MRNFLTYKGSLLLVALTVATAAAGPDFKTKSPQGKELTASQGTKNFLPSDDVIFALDSSVLTEAGMTQLDAVARTLVRRPDLFLVIEGYADHVGAASYNVDLATRRAAAAKLFLVQRGVLKHRIVTGVFGEAVADPAGNSLDRRVVVYATPRGTRELASYLLDTKQAVSATWTADAVLHIDVRSDRVNRISHR